MPRSSTIQLGQHRRVFEQFDWWSIEELGASVVHSADGQCGVCIAPVEGDAQIAWLRWAAVHDHARSPSVQLGKLLSTRWPVLRSQGVRSVWCICMRGNWLHTLLRDYGFVKADEIITMDQRATPQVLDIAAAPVLRDWRAADLSAVAAIDRAAFAAPWRYPLPVLERMIARAQVTCVAQLDAEIAAYLSASLDRGHAHIIRLAVTPAQKRQGIGSGLLSACAARLRHDGAVRVTLNTPASLDTLHFYRKHGFRALSDIADVFRYDL